MIDSCLLILISIWNRFILLTKFSYYYIIMLHSINIFSIKKYDFFLYIVLTINIKISIVSLDSI